MVIERRKFRRLKAGGVSGHVRVRDEVVARGVPVDNISLGGLFVRSSNPLPIGTPVVFELVHPGADPLPLSATTVATFTEAEAPGSPGPGMGIRFDALSVDATRYLHRLLVELSSERSVSAVPSGNDLEASRRSSFDFGFISLALASEGEVSSSPPPRQPTVLAPPAPRRGHLQPPRRVAVPAHAVTAPGVTPKVDESARLMVQVRGLLQELGAAQTELEHRSCEIADLRSELKQLRDELAERDARITELEQRLGFD